MTTAAPGDQLLLLDLQSIDTGLDQLAHRARTLPEHQQISELDNGLARLRDRLIAIRTEISDLEREVEKAESDVAAVRARAERDRTLLDSGSLSSSRDLENLVHEVASLGRRQADLEDAELQLLERLEEATKAHDDMAAEQVAAEAKRRDTVAMRDAVLAEIEASTAQFVIDRADVVNRLPQDLVALYEKVRTDHSGVGAAALYRGSCQGCRMQLPPADIGAIRAAAPDAVLRCEECRRILVRTPESGL